MASFGILVFASGLLVIVSADGSARPRSGVTVEPLPARENDMATSYSSNVTPLEQTGPEIAPAPIVRTIGPANLGRALRLGWEDFKAVPSHAVILCVIYPVLGLVLARTVLGYSVLPLLFPLAAGFALIGPFAALGLYELSRRREGGEPASAWDAVNVLRSPSFGAMLGLGVLLLALFVTWVATAQAIYVATFGYEAAAGIPDFARRVLTTPQGWWLIVAGCSVVCQRGFFPADARSSRECRRSDGDVAPRRCKESCADGDVGIDRSSPVGRWLTAVLPGSCRGHPAAWPRHLAPLSCGDRTGSEPAADRSPSAARAALGG
jgi:hypothetical protein